MKRDTFLQKIQEAFEINPVVALLGPRQCGKTTLARMYLEREKLFSPTNYFDLEKTTDLNRLANPELTLSELTGCITIDEVQRVPEIFPILRVMVDNEKLNHRYLILGSASGSLLRQSSESLAGRISYIKLTPFTLFETHDTNTSWIRGGFPKSYLAKDEDTSFRWRKDFIRSYLEVDIPSLGIRIPSSNLRRFWMMLTHFHGGIFNASQMGRSLQLSHNTIAKYLDILHHTFMIRVLKPWHANIKKRQVKSPKVYLRDSGIYHTLLGIQNKKELLIHPSLGASWEGFAIEEVIRTLSADQEDCYFWATHTQAELDLLIVRNGKRLGFEIKYSDAPKITSSMRTAIEDLKLDHLSVIYPGEKSFPMDQGIRAYGLRDFIEKFQESN